MTVIDASVAIDALLGDDHLAQPALAEIEQAALIEVPGVFVAEVMSALRSVAARGVPVDEHVGRHLRWARDLPTTTHAIDGLVPRIWELRHVVSVYDAWYVALAESLEVDLVTNDRRLQRAPGVRCVVRPPGG